MYLDILSNDTTDLGHDDDLMSWDVVFLQSGTNDFLGDAIGIHVCCIPSVDATIVRSLDQFGGLVNSRVDEYNVPKCGRGS